MLLHWQALLTHCKQIIHLSCALIINLEKYSSFGAKYAGEKTGIIYNNEMDDFSTPGTVNYFGVPASEPNYIKPGKRPMSSMTPIIVLDPNDNARLVLGASGGTKIITAVAQV